MRFSTVVAGAVAALCLAGSASAGLIGINEDATKFADDGGASLFAQLQDVGLRQNVVSAIWTAGQGLTVTDIGRINKAVAAGTARGIKIVIDIYPASGPNARALGAQGSSGFIDFVKQVVGTFHGTVKEYVILNEPNRTIFFSPVDPALAANVMAESYDAIKAIDPGVTVIGLGLSPRGSGDGSSLFPVQYLARFGAAYKALNRTAPVMDAISFHPYPFPEDKAPDRTSDWPTIGMADLARLKQAISDAFTGTGQKTVEGGLPIHLDEVAFQVSTDGKPGYSGNETVRLVDEATQARYYAQIVQQVACDPSIASLSFFHFVDETDRSRFQSGFLDAALGARPVVAAVKQSLTDTAGGTRCTGTPVNWVREGGVVGFDPGFSPDGKTALGSGKVWGFRPTAEEDASFFAGVFPADETAADAGRNLQARGRLLDSPPLFKLQGSIKAMLKGLAKFELNGKNGRYVYAISVTSTTNPTRSETVVSQPFTVGSGAAPAGKSASLTCKQGTADADGNPANGCEVKLQTDPKNCGRVGNVVRTGAFAVTGCTNGIPAIVKCAKGRYDIDKAFANGCESRVAPKPKKTGTSTCKQGTADADGNPANGCEVKLQTDPKNCGRVGNAVRTGAFAVTGCENGVAAIVKCAKGRYDIDKAFANGCESTVARKPKKTGK